ncbi:MAG: phosphoenolpyruvate--protein phosphotransferase [Syntrophales bacterium]|nr:phosphoenolpyruvate--protein phosphotransferase [Syntrophales bacterium]
MSCGTEVRLHGISICPGIGIGHVHLVDHVIHLHKVRIEPSQVPEEQARYMRAVETMQNTLQDHVSLVHESSLLSTKAILDVHNAILADESLHNRVRSRIASQKKNAEWCLEEEGFRLFAEFDAMKNPYFRARGEDIRDMVNDILSILTSAQISESFEVAATESKKVLASRHLYPSSVIRAYRTHAAGFTSESDALTSHAAILLKGLGIPSVGGVHDLHASIFEGDEIIVDGINGCVIVRPCLETHVFYQEFTRDAEVFETIPLPEHCVTKDGTEISLKANIENPHQVSLMLSQGLEGIGLFRTEFLLYASGGVPNEEVQYQVYSDLVNKAHGRPVIIRTFDVGADKKILSQECTGDNPSLGVRGIRRHLLGQTEELRLQLRAIVRASAHGNVGVLIPMVTTIDDVLEVKRHFLSIQAELRKSGVAFSENVAFGAMIETPAAAVSLKDILQEVDFVSIGTNDLLQYFMAADRDNEQVIHYQNVKDPAFLWLMTFIIQQAKKVNRESDVTICGEIASQAEAIPLLLQIGYRSFSVSPVSASGFRKICSHIDLSSTNDAEDAGSINKTVCSSNTKKEKVT